MRSGGTLWHCPVCSGKPWHPLCTTRRTVAPCQSTSPTLGQEDGHLFDATSTTTTTTGVSQLASPSLRRPPPPATSPAFLHSVRLQPSRPRLRQPPHPTIPASHLSLAPLVLPDA
ncbi:hypothetical protein E2C01_007210 [Portunus trituberculatus]|uniref:Uncharacterized protein n=1 Tax=Portunus trituberculatus TaxID=210409 RepID=A0A5B7D3S6_PORTR|nr:hypothetical protein [Portunus trituberculatus]